MTTQLQMFVGGTTDADVAALRDFLAVNGWQTREQLCKGLSWSERKVRDVAESLGTQIVRGQAGFKLTESITRDELPAAIQASDAAISQAKKMYRYGFGLRKKLHEVLG